MNILLLCFALAAPAAPNRDDDLPIESLQLPPNFSIEVAARISHARSLALSPRGTLFVGSRMPKGTVSALTPDGKVHTIAQGLDTPNGVALRNGALFVATHRQLLRWDAIEDHLDAPPAPVPLDMTFPAESHHGWRYLRTAPDGSLFVSIGAPCNICVSPDPFNTILRLVDNAPPQVMARGVRNSVGFDWHPQTQALWFTENGRDYLGDTRPPDELNKLSHPGEDFGFPYCNGDGLPDPDFGSGHDCSTTTPPVQRLGAHVAALGMRFYTGKQFPSSYRGQIFIAEHGSWNSSVKVGYRISVVDPAGPTYRPFISGWLQRDSPWGRPVDVEVAPDGSLFISDDHAGAIYRVRYTAPH